MARERIKWLDVLKCIGIIEIFFGHLGITSSFLWAFVWSHHVPLFFFASGCVVSHEKVPIKSVLLKKIRTLLIPWLCFAMFSTVLYALSNNLEASSLLNVLFLLVKGCIRNSFFAGSLWFLTCLFVICIVFELIKRLKNNVLIFLICFGLFIVSETALPFRPAIQPSYIWNIDSAMYYIVYYALGYIMCPLINKFLNLKDNVLKKLGLFLSGLASFIFCIAVYFKKNPLKLIETKPPISSIINLITSIIIIWALICISFLLQNISLLSKIGQNTLYACGNEYIITTLIECIFAALGLKLSFPNSLIGLMYSLFMLFIILKFLTPPEKKLVNFITEKIHE